VYLPRFDDGLQFRDSPDEIQGRRSEAESGASPGRVFWITGLSGAGKTTVGRELSKRLRAAGRPVTFLDGDTLRSVIAEDLGHSAGNRRRSAMRNARLCRLLAEQGVDVVCATISLFHEVQSWNRENIPGYCEICLVSRICGQVPVRATFQVSDTARVRLRDRFGIRRIFSW